MGGLSRRATFVSRERKGTVPVLLVDAGNLFSGSALSEPSLEPTVRKAELHLKAMDRMGYRAAALGEMDLYLGPERLRTLDEQTDIQFLSANLTNAEGKPLFKPYLLFDTGPLKVLILGITHVPNRLPFLESRMAGSLLKDPFETVAGMVPRLRKRCDLVIVLSNLGFREDLRLAREVEGINIIIGGKDRRFMRKPKIVDGTLVTSGYFQGRAVGKLTVSYDGPVRGWVSEEELRFLDEQTEAAGERGDQGKLEDLKTRREAARRLTRYRNNMVILDPSIPDDTHITSMIREYRGEKRK